MACPGEKAIASPLHPCEDCRWRLWIARSVSALVAQELEVGHTRWDETSGLIAGRPLPCTAGRSVLEKSGESAAFHCGDDLELAYHNPCLNQYDEVVGRLRGRQLETWTEIGRSEEELALGNWHPRTRRRPTAWIDSRQTPEMPMPQRLLQLPPQPFQCDGFDDALGSSCG